jgi:hypothetical protein
MPPKPKPDKEVIQAKTGSSEKCIVCNKPDEDKQAGIKWVQCDACDDWSHALCGGLDDKEYEVIKKGTTRLRWYCKDCNIPTPELLRIVKEMKVRCEFLEKEIKEIKNECGKSSNETKVGLEDLSNVIDAMNNEITSQEKKSTETQSQLVEMVDEKLQKSLKEMRAQNSFDDINKKIDKLHHDNKILEAKIESAVEERMIELTEQAEMKHQNELTKLRQESTLPVSWSEIASKSKSVDNKVEGMVAEVQKLQKMTNELQQEKTEQDEQNKRKNCAIIQGLSESNGSNTEERNKKDCDMVTDILHKIHCDNISVSSCFRLGKTPDPTSVKPRPIKIVLSSEAQKVQVLQAAKNLRGLSNDLAKVYIHQDLTQKQRTARQLLVKVMKERLAKGETNLIIIGEKIVTRRTRLELH